MKLIAVLPLCAAFGSTQSFGAGSIGARAHPPPDPTDGTCTLTVAGPRLGKAFEAVQMLSGVRDIGGATGPK